MLKDYWGGDALDYGDLLGELVNKYPDKLIVSASAGKPFAKSYVLYLCNPDEEDKAEEYLQKFRAKMAARGIRAYGAGITQVAKLRAERMEGFLGGIGL